MNSQLGWLAVGATSRVQCARKAEEVDLARCLECNWLLDPHRAAGTPALRCAAVSPVADGRDAGLADRHVD